MSSSTLTAYYLLWSLTVCLIFTSCDTLGNDSQPDTFSYSIQNNKQLGIDSTEMQSGNTLKTILRISIEDGNNRVFKYQRTTHPPENLMDAGFSESLYFQLPAEKEQFSYEDEQLKQLDTYYTRSCFCRIIGALPVSEGYIKGTKLGGTIWKIKGSIKTGTTFETREVTIDNIFIAQ